MINRDHRNPFGGATCEDELRDLGKEGYRELYFDKTPFTGPAGHRNTYLIVGRRGSGKTALVKYFSFQEEVPDRLCIEVRKPEDYQEDLTEISKLTREDRTIAIPRLRRVWEFVIWKLIANALSDDIPDLTQMSDVNAKNRRTGEVVADLLGSLINLLVEENRRATVTRVEQIVNAQDLEQVKRAAVQVAANRPINITIDTLELYNIDNEALMNALAALIEYASDFNPEYAPKRIHLKVFLAGEVFQHLKESVLLNPLRSVRNPVYLLWRPRDLLRLISRRFYRHFQETGLWENRASNINWNSYEDVLEKVWLPSFGRSLTNAQGREEATWPYVLRHTQMRPRQLILICNSIAHLAVEDETFPIFERDHIIEGIREAESDLASEIISSFSTLYPNVANIVEGLMGLPKVFEGNELDRRASASATHWPPGTHLKKDLNFAFRQMVAELGIIGRVTRSSSDSRYIDADFEYAQRGRLWLTSHDTCVVHPMFYRRLNVQTEGTEALVMPFGTRRGQDGQL